MTIETTKELRLILPSEPKSIEKLEPFLRRCWKPNNKETTLFNDVLLVLTEAVNNGMVHGNESNPDKLVTVVYSSSNKIINFTVVDEGKGFNYDKVPDPTHQSRIDQPCGRGVFIMQQLAYKVSYQNKGRKVLIQFRK